MKYIPTKELQKAYDNWYLHVLKIGEQPDNFWDFIGIVKDDDTYQVHMDAWAASPETVAKVHMLNSPYRGILYKVWKIRHRGKPSES
jgi:hypothetical protein